MRIPTDDDAKTSARMTDGTKRRLASFAGRIKPRPARPPRRPRRTPPAAASFLSVGQTRVRAPTKQRTHSLRRVLARRVVQRRATRPAAAFGSAPFSSSSATIAASFAAAAQCRAVVSCLPRSVALAPLRSRSRTRARSPRETAVWRISPGRTIAVEGAIGARAIHDGSWSPHVARRAAPFSSGARGDASPRVPVAAGMDRAEELASGTGAESSPSGRARRSGVRGSQPATDLALEELRLLKTTHTEERFPDVGAVPPRACGRFGGPCGTSMDALGVATGAVPADELRQVTTTLWTSIEASINRVELPEVRRALGVTALEENERLMEEATALAEIIGDVRHRVDTAAHRRLNAQKSLYSNPTRALVEGELRLLIASPVVTDVWPAFSSASASSSVAGSRPHSRQGSRRDRAGRRSHADDVNVVWSDIGGGRARSSVPRRRRRKARDDDAGAVTIP